MKSNREMASAHFKRTRTSKRVGKYLISVPKEPKGFCVWCNEPYYDGDKTATEPATREVHCSQACVDDHLANL